MDRRTWAQIAILLALGSACGTTAVLNNEASPRKGTALRVPRDGITSPSTAVAAATDLFGPALKPAAVRLLWSRKLPGLMTDLVTAPSEGWLVVATVPDPDDSSSGSEHRLTLWARDGRQVWSHAVAAQTKSLSISSDGNLIVLANYSNRLQALDRSGRRLWDVEGSCRPVILTRERMILCFHDDDVSPSVAFDVLDWRGKKRFSYETTQDPLALKVSPDGKRFALALTGGQVILFSAEDGQARSIWQAKVKGELVDVSVASEPATGGLPRVAALVHRPEGQRLLLLGEKGAIAAEAGVPIPGIQVEIGASGDTALVYGNGTRGQVLSYFATGPAPDGKSGPVFSERWSRQSPKAADYSSSLVATRELAILGFEEARASGRASHVLGFDLEGRMVWDIPLVTEEGAYLYAQAYSPGRSLLGVGTDDRKLTAYQIEH